MTLEPHGDFVATVPTLSPANTPLARKKMEHERRTGGRETWNRLREWDKGQSESERLAARLLPNEGFCAVDPSHPLGGRDGGKDVACKRDGKSWIVAAYFPRGQQLDSAIRTKFGEDAKKVSHLKADGIVFFTNQELPLSLRAELEDSVAPLACDIYHLERIASCLDTPKGYGLRLEFLSMQMTKEEQVSYFNDRDKILLEIKSDVALLVEKKKPASGISTVYVDSHQYDRLYHSSAFGESRLIECRKCGEVFRASRIGLSTSTLSVGFPQDIETVTCPECGKVQAFR
jgi:hypothetical protein